MPFFALLSVYGIWKVWKLHYWHWLIIVAASFAMVLNSHYLGLLLVPFLGLWWLLAKKTDQSKRYTLSAIVLFLLLMSPLLWFDMRHGWNNFAAMKTFFSDRQTTVNAKVYKSIPNLWPVYKDIVSSLVVAKQSGFAGPVAIAILVLAGLAYWQNRSKELVFIASWLMIGVVGLGLYKQHIYDHYYGFLFPAPFLLLGFGLGSIWNKTWGKVTAGILVAVLAVTYLVNSPVRPAPNRQLAKTMEVARFISDQAGGKPFNLALLAERNYDKSYVYFLTQPGAGYYTIHQILADQLFVICEKEECEPINNPLWEIAAFGWAKIDRTWEFPWGVKLLKLVHNTADQ